jgi:hypothetical protein
VAEVAEAVAADPANGNENEYDFGLL